jgi:hypothetical protein
MLKGQPTLRSGVHSQPPNQKRGGEGARARYNPLQVLAWILG